jgi:hypothetical protein
MDPTLNFDNLIPRLKSPGLKVINFHPAHMAFNTPNFAYTRSIKDSFSREIWGNLGLSQLQKLENREQLGVRKTIQQVIEFASSNDYKVLSMREIYHEHQAG